jgi:hypothetical protein
VLVLLIVAASVGFLLLFSQLRGNAMPVRAEADGNVLSAIDAAGRTVWTKSFPEELAVRGTRHDRSPGRMVHVTDFLGNGSRQVLFVASYARADASPEVSDALYCYSESGTELWRYEPKITVRMRDKTFTGPWLITDFVVSKEPGQRAKIWITLGHWMLRPGVLVALDAAGKPDVKFINAGHLYAVNVMASAQGRYVLAGGINNEHASAMLAVIREDAPLACSPQTAGTVFECLDVRNEGPEKYFLFPPTEVNQAEGLPYNRVTAIDAGPDEVTIHTLEEGKGIEGAGIGSALYGLSRERLEIENVAFDDSWASAHGRLERRIKHTLALCPVIHGPSPIRRWDRASGFEWVKIPLKNGVVPRAYMASDVTGASH